MDGGECVCNCCECILCGPVVCTMGRYDLLQHKHVFCLATNSEKIRAVLAQPLKVWLNDIHVNKGGSMGYAKSRLRPVMKKPYRGVWVWVIMVFVVGLAMAFLLRNANLGLRGSVGACDSSGKLLDLGDYSDLQDSDFCRRYGIDASKVRTKYDSSRHADIYIGTFSDQKQQMVGAWIQRIVEWTECSNQIVEKQDGTVMTTEGDKGTAKFNRGCRSVAEVLVDEIDDISSFSCPGNRIVASSMNVKCRGCNVNDTRTALRAAIGDVVKGGGCVAIEWQTPKFFIAWHVLSHKGVFMMLKRKSNCLIRSEALGNEN